jgi:hypothetical protein
MLQLEKRVLCYSVDKTKNCGILVPSKTYQASSKVIQVGLEAPNLEGIAGSQKPGALIFLRL